MKLRSLFAGKFRRRMHVQESVVRVACECRFRPSCAPTIESVQDSVWPTRGREETREETVVEFKNAFIGGNCCCEAHCVVRRVKRRVIGDVGALRLFRKPDTSERPSVQFLAASFRRPQLLVANIYMGNLQSNCEL